MNKFVGLMLPHMQELAENDLHLAWKRFADAVKAMDNVYRSEPTKIPPFLGIQCLLAEQVAGLHIAQAFYKSVNILAERIGNCSDKDVPEPPVPAQPLE